MRLDSIDHVTGITADGQRCLDFYAGILGLRFVGRGADFEAPGSDLLSLAPEPDRSAGVLSFIEASGRARGRAGDGMVHTLSWSVPSAASVDYWGGRLAEAGIETHRNGGRLHFADPEGLRHELVVEASRPEPSRHGGSSPVPPQHAIGSLVALRAFGRAGVASADILAGRLGFRVTGREAYEVSGERRTTAFAFDEPPRERAVLGAGTIHHVAWGCQGSLAAWRQRVIGMGCRVTPVIDRGHRRSIYFREPSGVLFELVAPGSVELEDTPASASTRRISPAVDPRVPANLV
jgi:glyoxalase family protein